MRNKGLTRIWYESPSLESGLTVTAYGKTPSGEITFSLPELSSPFVGIYEATYDLDEDGDWNFMIKDDNGGFQTLHFYVDSKIEFLYEFIRSHKVMDSVNHTLTILKAGTEEELYKWNTLNKQGEPSTTEIYEEVPV